MERAKLNPDFLKKDELCYEIFVRNGGEPSDLKVPQLQKFLRELFSLEVRRHWKMSNLWVSYKPY
jgi:hypothetical protein